MAKTHTTYVCQQCSYQSSSYLGRCPECGSWNSLVEQIDEVTSHHKKSSKQVEVTQLSDIERKDYDRLSSGINEFNRVLGGGIVLGSVVLVAGDPGIGKCVTGDTRVLDPNTGLYLPITEWKKTKRTVLALNDKDNRLIKQKVSDFHDQGVKPVIQIRTRLGHTLICTLNHPLLTPLGWKSANELSPGVHIATPRALPFFGKKSLPVHKVKMIAYFLSYESTQQAISVTSFLPEVEDDFKDLAEKFNLQLRITKKETRGKQFRFVIPSPIARFLNSLDLKSIRASEKYVPKCVFQLPRDQLAIFMKTLFSCDGSVYFTKGQILTFSYSTISKQLAEDVQHLLLRFGLIVKLRIKSQSVNNNRYKSYELQMLGEVVKRFLEEIGIWGSEEAKLKIEKTMGHKLPLNHFDTIPVGTESRNDPKQARGNVSFMTISKTAGFAIQNRRYSRPLTRSPITAPAKVIRQPILKPLASGDIYWDKIESILPQGEEQVYDLTVPNLENFIANDLIIHNSTLLSQLSIHVENTLYVAGEESPQQIKYRVDRINKNAKLAVLNETDVDAIAAAIEQIKPPLVIVDSIQTMETSDLESAAGSVSQVRETAHRLQKVAKAHHIPIFIVGHVTKEGSIAGPRTLEHLVDVVLTLEGDPTSNFRILRGIKNRFGPTDEVGIFEMDEEGMKEVKNPSEVFLGEKVNAPGSAIVAVVSGLRPMLLEIQALVTKTYSPIPRRVGTGIDNNRLQLLVAVISKRLQLPLYDQDIFVNVTGGIKVIEPAADLAICMAIISSFKDIALDPKSVFIGEVGLLGELRTVRQLDKRINESKKMGFISVICPPEVKSLANVLSNISARKPTK